jgi:hypothetical protein
MTKPTWSWLGGGTFNNAYANEDNTLVLKVMKDIRDSDGSIYRAATDLPERSIKLWNEINNHPELPPAVAYIDTENPSMNGWTCPLIKGKNASDSEISMALLDVFNRSGRIVIDAYVPGNFIKSEKGPVVCVDIGMALKLQKQEDLFFAQSEVFSHALVRSHSVTSVKEWESNEHRSGYKEIYGSFPLLSKIFNPNTVNTTKALLFIKAYRPDIFNVDFLKTNKSLVGQLASAYDKSLSSAQDLPEPKEIANAKKALMHEKPPTVAQLKENCKLELERYILSRGMLSDSGEYSPSGRTKFFRDTMLTGRKVDIAQRLIEQISGLNTADEIKAAIEVLNSRTDIPEQVLGGDFLKRINKCLFIVNHHVEEEGARKTYTDNENETSEQSDLGL